MSCTGSTVANVHADLNSLFATAVAADLSLANAYLVMRGRTGLYLSSLRTAQDVRAFPEINIRTGGTLLGVPVLISNAVPVDTGADAYIALVLGDEVFVADDGEADVAISTEGALQMDSAPSAGPQALTSLYQNDLTTIRLIRAINWRRRHDAGVAVLSDVPY